MKLNKIKIVGGVLKVEKREGFHKIVSSGLMHFK